MFKNICILSLVLCFFSCTCKNNTGKKDNVATEKIRLNTVEFSNALQNSDAQLVDARTPGEYEAGHIKGATLANVNDNPSFEENTSKLDKNKPVYVYCKAGVRSKRAAKKLREEGFKEVYDLLGGFDAWTNDKLPVEN